MQVRPGGRGVPPVEPRGEQRSGQSGQHVAAARGGQPAGARRVDPHRPARRPVRRPASSTPSAARSRRSAPPAPVPPPAARASTSSRATPEQRGRLPGVRGQHGRAPYGRVPRPGQRAAARPRRSARARPRPARRPSAVAGVVAEPRARRPTPAPGPPCSAAPVGDQRLGEAGRSRRPRPGPTYRTAPGAARAARRRRRARRRPGSARTRRRRRRRPRRYLSLSAPGRGSSAATSACWSASSSGAPQVGPRPMSTSRSAPAYSRAGSMQQPRLVRAEGDGRVGPHGRARAPRRCRRRRRWAGPRRRRRPATRGGLDQRHGLRRAARPCRRCPTMPSTTRSARAMTAPPGRLVRRRPRRPTAPSGAPAGRAQRRQPARVRTLGRRAVRRVTPAPRRASRAPAKSASPPLSPLPTSSTTRAPYTRPSIPRTRRRARPPPAASAPRRAAAPSTPARRPVRSPRCTQSSYVQSDGHAAGGTTGSAPGRRRPRPSGPTASALRDHHGRGHPRVVRQRHMPTAHAQLRGAGRHRSPYDAARAARSPRRRPPRRSSSARRARPAPSPGPPSPRSAPPGRRRRVARRSAAVNSASTKSRSASIGRALQRLGEPVDLGDVDADPHDHLEPPPAP